MLHNETVSRKETNELQAQEPRRVILRKAFKRHLSGAYSLVPNRAHYCIMEIVRNSALSFVE